jgi:hypothetical protein
VRTNINKRLESEAMWGKVRPTATMLHRSLLIAAGALALLGCSAADDHPPPAPRGGVVGAPGKLATVSDAAPATQKPANAELQLTAVEAVRGFLGTLRATVTNAAGDVVTGTFEEVGSLAARGTHELNFALPADDRYTVSLLAVTSASEPVTCRASVGDLALEAGVQARVQVFGWDCGRDTDPVPVIDDAACARLADWSFVGRASAETGQPVPLAVSARATSEALARVAWSVPDAAFGEFSEPTAWRTDFHCAEPAGDVPLTLRLTEGACEQTVTQTVACH